jgi:hypothetical protein
MNVNRQKIGSISSSGAKIPFVSATRVAIHGTDDRHSSAIPKVERLILAFTRLFRSVLCSEALVFFKIYASLEQTVYI